MVVLGWVEGVRVVGDVVGWGVVGGGVGDGVGVVGYGSIGLGVDVKGDFVWGVGFVVGVGEGFDDLLGGGGYGGDGVVSFESGSGEGGVGEVEEDGGELYFEIWLFCLSVVE